MLTIIFLDDKHRLTIPRMHYSLLTDEWYRNKMIRLESQKNVLFIYELTPHTSDLLPVKEAYTRLLDLLNEH